MRRRRRRRSAAAGRDGRRCSFPPGGRDGRCATRSTPADRDFALDYLYACAMLASHPPGSARSSCWVDERAAFIHPRTRGDRVVRDAAEAEPRRWSSCAASRPALGRLAGLLATVKGLPLPTTATCRRTSRRCSRRGEPAVEPGRARSCRRATFDRGRPPLVLDRCSMRRRRGAIGRGVPFREAHERGGERARRDLAPPAAPEPRGAPGPGGVTRALEDAPPLA